jgi:hypothetical protein
MWLMGRVSVGCLDFDGVMILSELKPGTIKKGKK